MKKRGYSIYFILFTSYVIIKNHKIKKSDQSRKIICRKMEKKKYIY